MELGQNSSWTPGPPRDKGYPTRPNSKEQLGADHHYPHPGSSHFPFRGIKAETQELSPKVIFVHLKFPTTQTWSLDFLYPHRIICKLFIPCLKWSLYVGRQRVAFPLAEVSPPTPYSHLAHPWFLDHFGLGVIALSTPFRFFKQLCKKEVTCHNY